MRTSKLIIKKKKLKLETKQLIFINKNQYVMDSDLKKKYPDKINELEEAFLDYIGENDLKLLKTEFPDKWRYLTKKLAYPYEYFNSIEDSRLSKTITNLLII